MGLWETLVEVLRQSIFAYAQITNGSVAYGIMVVTCLARLALLPLTLRVAERAAAQQAALGRLRPELDAVRARFSGDPGRVAAETQRILGREGLSLIPAWGCAGMLLQAPVLLALFQAVRDCAALGGRFLWVRDIARPDPFVTLGVAVLTGIGIIAGPLPEGQSRAVLLALPTMMTFLVLWHMAAGVGLYWGVSSAIGVAQGLVVRQRMAGVRVP